MSDLVPITLPDDEHLKDDERWVRHLLEGTVGQTRVIDRRGGSEQGKHDLEVDLPDGSGIAAVEITSAADSARLKASARADRYLSGLTVPGSQIWWLVQYTPQADARELSRSASLVALLTAMEGQGVLSASSLSDYRDPWRDQLKALSIQSVDGIEGSSHPGVVSVMPDFVASYGWAGPRADGWVNEFLASDLGKSKLAKLARAVADERHLVVQMYPDRDGGLGIAGALADLLDGEGGGGLPSAEPPDAADAPLADRADCPDEGVPVGAQLGLVSSPFPTRAATGGLSRRLLRAGAASREAGAVPAARAPKAGEAASRQEMYVPELLATQARSCAAMAAG